MKAKLLASLRASIATLFLVFATGLTTTAPAFAAEKPACPTGIGLSQDGNNCKITVCHRTDSETNPYTEPTVSYDAATGAFHDNGDGDHTTHTGDVWYPGHPKEPKWGDIIPPIPGIYPGMNWTAAGQAIYFNGCAPLTTATPAPVTFTDVCGTDGDGYTIPTTTGVVYKVNNVTVSAGFHAATGSVTVTAVAKSGYTLSGTATWSHTFDTTACPVEVTPGTVTFTDVCGIDNDGYTIPTTTGVDYKVSGSVVSAGFHKANGSVTVTAVAQTGYTLTGTTSWSHSFTNVECPVELTPVIPGTVTFSDTCGTANDTYTIPSTTGVDYKVGGSVKAAGTYAGSGTVTVTAVAQAGYTLTGNTTSWSHTFTDENCPVPPTDVCLNIDGIQTTIPDGMTVDNAGNCTTPSVIGTITGGSGGQVLGASTSAPSVNAKELVNTGSSALVNLFVGLFIVGLATATTVFSRKSPARANFTSSASN